jgi:hypothetical protein
VPERECGIGRRYTILGTFSISTLPLIEGGKEGTAAG